MRIAFCGVGALGSTAAVLCRNLDATLRLVDFDRVETKNLLSQAYVKQSLGKNKAEALKLQLANFYGIKSEAYPVRLGAHNAEALLHECNLLVDCFDNHESRVRLSEYARSADKALVHAALAADGTIGLVRWDAQFHADAEDQVGAATCEDGRHLPLIGQLAATLARALQDFIAHGEQHNYFVFLSGVHRS